MTDNISRACQQLEKNDASLTLLNLSCEGIGSRGVERLSQSCNCCHKSLHSTATSQSPLVALWLESNYIYPKGASALSELVKKSPSLKYLYMAHNSINNSGAAEITSVAMNQLEVLNIAENEIGPMGAREIATSLRDKSCKLRNLILESNHLRDDGICSLADGLRDNTSLKNLDLRYNRIGVEGLTALRDMLKEDNKTLEYLFLEEDCDCASARRPKHPMRRDRKCPRIQSSSAEKCTCERCKLYDEIEYYLALNRAGRHSFGNMGIPASLWPRVMAHAPEDEPSILYAMLKSRPDVVS